MIESVLEIYDQVKDSNQPVQLQGLDISLNSGYRNLGHYYNSRLLSKPAFCICENKDADQLRGNREADQLLCFRYADSTIPLLPIYEISNLSPAFVVVQPGSFLTWSETSKTGFLTTRLIIFYLGSD